MAWDFEAIGWEEFPPGDYEGSTEDLRHDGTPSDLSATHGVLVRAEDENTGDVDYFWAYAGGDFESWAEWWVYIGALMEMYGMALEA